MRKLTALIDLDGSLLDWHGAMTRDMAKILAPSEIPSVPLVAEGGFDFDEMEKIPHYKARMDLIKSQPGWWRDLQWLPQGREIYEAVLAAGYRPHILSKGPKRMPLAWGEKVAWVRAETPQAKVTLSEEKFRVSGAVLVDDWLPFGKPWLERHQGLWIIPDQPWNQGFEHPRAVRIKGLGWVPALTEILSKHRDQVLTARSSGGTTPASTPNP